MHAALGDPTRLAIIDHLVLSDRSPGELAVELGIGSNLLAHHLESLARAGLVERTASHGDARRRYLRLRPEAFAFAEPSFRVGAARVVFVCTANSARSLLARALWEATSAVPAASGGTEPAARPHPGAVRA
ncbi:MAG: helix-turn-helix domain-containing protein, partial [Acidimicrobiales bacterium]